MNVEWIYSHCSGRQNHMRGSYWLHVPDLRYVRHLWRRPMHTGRALMMRLLLLAVLILAAYVSMRAV